MPVEENNPEVVLAIVKNAIENSADNNVYLHIRKDDLERLKFFIDERCAIAVRDSEKTFWFFDAIISDEAFNILGDKLHGRICLNVSYKGKRHSEWGIWVFLDNCIHFIR